jgi:hypothetical protein
MILTNRCRGIPLLAGPGNHKGLLTSRIFLEQLMHQGMFGTKLCLALKFAILFRPFGKYCESNEPDYESYHDRAKPIN